MSDWSEALEGLDQTCGGQEIFIPKTLPKKRPLANLPLQTQKRGHHG